MAHLQGNESTAYIQARSFAQQNSILKPRSGVETTCRGGVTGAAYRERAVISPYGGMKDAG
jgi:hypothetical protein